MQNLNSKFKINLKTRVYKFALEVVIFLKEFSNSYIDQTMGKQLLRSATSIGANIIEAQSASSKREFKNFINIALKSANETKFWLCLIRDVKIHRQTVRLNLILKEAIEYQKF